MLLNEERAWVEAVQSREPSVGRIAFCAKKCAHKAIHRLVGTWLDFPELGIEGDLVRERFTFLPHSPAACPGLSGTRTEGVILRSNQQLVAVRALFSAHDLPA